MKALLIFLAAFSAVTFLVIEARKSTRSGEEGAEVWFYDQHSQRLYAVSRDTVPPDHDGVRAFVVAPRGQPRDKKIAYLETFAPALKNVLEAIRQDRLSGRTHPGEVPARNSPFFLTNSLVRLPDGSAWVAASSPEGRQITSAWRSWRGPDGSAWEISVP